MPRKVDFHTEWAMPDPADYEDVGNDERESDAFIAQASEETEHAMQAAQTLKRQTKEKWFVAGGPAY